MSRPDLPDGFWGLAGNVARCTGTRKVPLYPYVKNDTILHIFGIGTSLKKHAIRAHSLFRSLSGCLHALTARAGLPSSHMQILRVRSRHRRKTHRHTQTLQIHSGKGREHVEYWLSTYQTDTPNFSESSKNVSKCDYKHEHPSSPIYSL